MKLFRRERAEPLAVAQGGLEFRRPWIRPDSRNPMQAGGYVIILNKAGERDRLLAATSPMAESVEIHAIRVVGGGILMQPLPEGLMLPPDVTISLRPRGYHLLLKGLQAPLAVGSRVPATLSFERAGSVDVTFVVEEPGPVGEAVLDQDHHRP